MIGSNCIVFSWNRALPGRESNAGQLFKSFTEYLAAQQRDGSIESFEAVLLEPHGGTTNGLILIRGEPARLQALMATEEWLRNQAKGMINLQGIAIMRGVSGPALAERMKIWMEESARR